MSLSEYAEIKGVKYFLISFVDLFGTMRAKIVPATAIDAVAKSGAGFAGFAAWFDMTPAHPDVLVYPDPETVIQLPWKPEVAWVTGDLMMDGKPVDQNPRQVLKRVIASAAADGVEMKTGVECEYFLISPDGTAISDAAHQRMIVHGGSDGTTVELSDTYILSLPASGPLAWTGPLSAPKPIGREQHGAVYDSLHNRMLIFGGLDNDLSDGFPLNQDSWSLSLDPTPAWSPLLLAGTPGFRLGHSAAYDELNQRMVIFGGDRDSTLNLTDEMWGMRLDGTPSWNLMVPGGPKPSARYAHTALYDAVNQRIVIFGGFDSTFTELNDVWVIQM